MGIQIRLVALRSRGYLSPHGGLSNRRCSDVYVTRLPSPSGEISNLFTNVPCPGARFGHAIIDSVVISNRRGGSALVTVFRLSKRDRFIGIVPMLVKAVPRSARPPGASTDRRRNDLNCRLPAHSRCVCRSARTS